MDIRNILLIIIGLLSLVFAGYIYGRNRKSDINISFALMWLFAAIWSLGLGFFRTTSSLELALSYQQILHLSAFLIVPSFIYFSIVFPYPSGTLTFKKIVLIYSPTILVAILLFIPNFVIGTITIKSGNNNIHLNQGFLFYALIFSIYVVISFLLLYKKFRMSEGINRIQLKYTIIGLLIGFLIGMVCDLILPAMNNLGLNWAGPLSAFVVMGFVFYLIMRK